MFVRKAEWRTSCITLVFEASANSFVLFAMSAFREHISYVTTSSTKSMSKACANVNSGCACQLGR